MPKTFSQPVFNLTYLLHRERGQRLSNTGCVTGFSFRVFPHIDPALLLLRRLQRFHEGCVLFLSVPGAIPHGFDTCGFLRPKVFVWVFIAVAASDLVEEFWAVHVHQNPLYLNSLVQGHAVSNNVEFTPLKAVIHHGAMDILLATFSVRFVVPPALLTKAGATDVPLLTNDDAVNSVLHSTWYQKTSPPSRDPDEGEESVVPSNYASLPLRRVVGLQCS